MDNSVGIVVIGRNEGERLRRCLLSVSGAAACVYVDSGSGDGSVDLAHELGVAVVPLHSPPRFTAARARNVGLNYLLANWPDCRFVQMVDGDCEIRSGWLTAGLAALEAEPGVALVFGRRRERFPDRSIYNALCDDEWNVALGEATVAGGDILCRVAALRAIGGYREDMVAGEDPDMALRLRAKGWRLRRIDAEMTWHDAAIYSFMQWWKRAERAGHAYADLTHRHPASQEPNWRRKCFSIALWALVIPALTLAAGVLAAAISNWAILATMVLIFAWPYKMVRIAAAKRKSGLDIRTASVSGILLMVGKFPEFLGIVRFYYNRCRGQSSELIEYKRLG